MLKHQTIFAAEIFINSKNMYQVTRFLNENLDLQAQYSCNNVQKKN